MPGTRPLKAIICDSDAWELRALEPIVRDAGFDIVGEASHAIDAIRLTGYLRPTLVLISHEQSGLSGLEAISELRQGDDPPEVILLALDPTGREPAKDAGAFELAVKGEAAMLARMLAEVRVLLETGERRKTNDRRSEPNRREAQDWSKVTHERRSGTDRRLTLRRELDVTSTARDILLRRRQHSDA